MNEQYDLNGLPISAQKRVDLQKPSLTLFPTKPSVEKKHKYLCGPSNNRLASLKSLEGLQYNKLQAKYLHPKNACFMMKKHS